MSQHPFGSMLCTNTLFVADSSIYFKSAYRNFRKLKRLARETDHLILPIRDKSDATRTHDLVHSG